MNNLDFEKTQIWAKNLVQASVTESAAAEPQPQKPKPVTLKKPEMKKLSPEEKITLAAGGALAIGLGAIVISSLGDNVSVPVTNSQKTPIVAPKLDFGNEPDDHPVSTPLATSILSTPPPAPSHAAKRPEPHTAPAPAAAAKEEQHALLEIPEVPEVATTVADEMTFLDAFSKAREEVGPAGLFAWKGTYYSTFTDKEWDSVSDQKQEKWLHAAQPIIEPDDVMNESIAGNDAETAQNVVVAERGSITWTGIDKNGDGQTDILMARIQGQSPMVLMDTDQDGILDTRYDYEPVSGKTFASEIQPFPMSTTDVENMEEVTLESDMGFFTNKEFRESAESVPVSILEEHGTYLVSTAHNEDKIIDTLTFFSDRQGPVVGLDHDNDGQIEMGFVYNSESGTITALEMEPLEEINLESPDLPAIFPVDSFGLTYESDADEMQEEDEDEATDPFSDEDPDYDVYS